MTPAILQDLAVTDMERITGFMNLRRSDQAKVRQAIARKRVDPTDVPETAKNSQSASTAVPPVTQKREADATAGPSSSQTRVPLSSQPTADRRGGTSTQGVTDLSDDENEGSEEESKDELYCIMSTQVVGLQYYKGIPIQACYLLNQSLLLNQGWLVLAKKLHSFESHRICMIGKPRTT